MMSDDNSWGQTKLVVDRVEPGLEALIAWAHTEKPDAGEAEGSGLLRPVDGSPWIKVQQFRRIGPSGFELAMFDPSGPPIVGASYWLQYAWTSDVLLALRASTWRRDVLPDHVPDFCPVTYKTLTQGDAAYVNDAGLWISVAAWEEYVRDDNLRLRSFHWPDRRDIPAR